MPRVFDLIRPLDNRDTYAITDVIFQKGGLREVETIVERNAISQERRRNGMITFVTASGEFYSLTGGDLTNNSWEKIDFAKNLEKSIAIEEIIIKENNNSILNENGENLSVVVDTSSILKLENGDSIISLSDINHQDGKLLFVQNVSDHNIIIKNNYFSTVRTIDEIFDDSVNLKQVIATENFKFIIGTETSEISNIIKSNNFETFEYIEIEEQNSWQSGTYGLDKLVIVSNNGDNRVLFTEDEGVNWTPTTVSLNSWQSITYGDNLFVAVASDGDDRVMYSSDAITWSYSTVSLNNWQSITHGNDIFVAVASDGDDRVMYSSDAITWNYITTPFQNQYFKIKFLNNKFYAISENDIIVSENGILWEVLDLPFSSNGIKDIIYNEYYLFFKNNIVYYTLDLENFNDFSFSNLDDINDSYYLDNFYYLLMENKILSLTLDTVLDNNYPIFTGLNRNMPLLTGASALLQFSLPERVWRIIGGLSVDPTFLQLLDTPDAYPTVSENNNIFLSINPNQTQDQKIIFNNPFPIVSNDEENLVLKNINNLRIRSFDNETGEIVFAKFEPTISMDLDQVINFDTPIQNIENINVTNDSFLENIKVKQIISLSYYKNNDDGNIISFTSLDPVLPTDDNLNYNWSESFSFDTLPDSNINFATSPTSFTITAILKDTNNMNYTVTKTITQNLPDFNFTVNNAISDFRNQITSANLSFTYLNVDSATNSTEITSITSDTPDTPIFNNLVNGMTTYTINNLSINADDLFKSNNLTDTVVYNFSATCKFIRPLSIDVNQNYFEISKQNTFNVTFNYPVFVGTTSITKTSLTNSDVIAMTNSGAANFPRNFSSTVGNSNVHFWFCVRKRFINNRTPTVVLSSSGVLSLPTVIIHTNEVELTSFNSTETYVCYSILLQANYLYNINISI